VLPGWRDYLGGDAERQSSRASGPRGAGAGAPPEPLCPKRQARLLAGLPPSGPSAERSKDSTSAVGEKHVAADIARLTTTSRNSCSLKPGNKHHRPRHIFLGMRRPAPAPPVFAVARWRRLRQAVSHPGRRRLLAIGASPPAWQCVFNKRLRARHLENSDQLRHRSTAQIPPRRKAPRTARAVVW